MKNMLRSFFYLATSLALIACDAFDGDSKSSSMKPEKTIVEIAVENDDLDTLVTALQAAGLDDTLADPKGSFTVFAPTDAAFALLGEEAINALLADTDALEDVLLYHVISGTEINSVAATAAAGTKVTMANGGDVGVSRSVGKLYVNLSTVTVVDIHASNGIIHLIDAVLMPPAAKGMPADNIVETAVANGGFTKLVAALQAAELDAVLADETKSFTVFAPTDAAFSMIGEDNLNKLLEDKEALTNLLLQHVVSDIEVDAVTAFTLNGTKVASTGGFEISIGIVDGKLNVGGANVIIKDIYTSNGIIHAIDAVITGDINLPMSIVEVATKLGGFSTLLAAVDAADLTGVLDDLNSTWTVFAPTDVAFAALGDEAVAELLADPVALANILKYHLVADSAVMASAATMVANSEDPLFVMANGDKAALSISGETLLINTSSVVSANVGAFNGVIHAVDKVLLPPKPMTTPADNIVETAVAAGNFTTLVAALQATGLDETLADESQTFTVFAPTDAAFALLGEETIAALLNDIEGLTSILLTHVVSGAAVNSVSAYGLNGTSVTTAGGAMIDIAIESGQLTVGGSVVSTTDIYTANGIIHVIDAVITSSGE